MDRKGEKSKAAYEFITQMQEWGAKIDTEERSIMDTAHQSWDSVNPEPGAVIGAIINTPDGEIVTVFISAGERENDIHHLATMYQLRQVEFLTPERAVRQSMFGFLDSMSDSLEPPTPFSP